jgi:hypothetical protein
VKAKVQPSFFCLGLLVVAAVCFTTVGWVSADSPVRVPAAKQRVVKRWAFNAEPILLTNLHSKGLSVSSGKPFAADDEWLQGLRFDVENKSMQSIAFLKVHVLLYGVKGFDSALSIPLQWGEPPTLRGGRVVSESLNPLAPGGKISLAVTEEMYARVKNLVEQEDSITNVREVRLLTSSVMYTDGTVWKGGSLLSPDKTRAGVWTEKKGESAKNNSYLAGSEAYGHTNIKASLQACSGCRRVSGSIFLECCSGECFMTPERTTFASGPGCAQAVAVTLSCQPCSFQTCLTQESAPCYGDPEG